MSEDELRILFVGPTRQSATSRNVGGTMVACRTLLESRMRSKVRWVLVDNTYDDYPVPPVWRRTMSAMRRFFTFTRALREVDLAFLFVSSEFGFYEKGLLAVVARWAGVPAALSPRFGDAPEVCERSRLAGHLVPFVLRRSALVVCQSEGWASFYRQLGRLPESKVVAVGNWIDVKGFRGVVRARERREVSGGTTFLFLARVEESKGFDDLVEAVSREREALRDARFLICGGSSDPDRVRSLVRRRGLEHRFEFRGWVEGEARNEALAAADVLVLPSHYEGVPNAVLEAMACGIAVVASDVGGIPELLGLGTRGFLVPPVNPQSLAEALVLVHRDRTLRETVGLVGRRFVESERDVEKVWPRLFEVFRKLAARQERRIGENGETS